jgi:putative CocE/NonD family hydrolase
MSGQVNFGTRASAGGAGVPLDHLSFFRRHLLGEAGETSPVRYFLMGANEWRSDSTWPPAKRQPQQLFLQGGGGLSATSAPSDRGVDRYLFDPADPTPTMGGRNMPYFTVSAGPIDQHALAARRDILRYDAPPQDGSIDIVGSPTATIFVETNAPIFDIMVKLIDVAPDGVALPITDGIRRTTVEAGEAQAVHQIEISLADTAWRVLPGHRLRVQVQSGNYPHFDANPGTANPLGTDAVGRPAVIGIVHDEFAQSVIRFDALQVVSPRDSLR